jgi:predicted anti-sigma-YlaC factor YlaD
MNHEDIKDRLNDYVDGALSEAERLDIEEHLVSCSECRQIVDETRALLREARSLRTGISPSRDLWPGIATRITGKRVVLMQDRQRVRHRFWVHQSLLAAAAVLVVAVITLSVVRYHWEGGLMEETRLNVLNEFDQVDTATNAASTRLFGSAQTETSSWAGRAIDAMSKNVKVVDRAIEDLRSALRSDPTDSRLAHQLRREYQRKTALLRQTAELIQKLNSIGSVDSLT